MNVYVFLTSSNKSNYKVLSIAILNILYPVVLGYSISVKVFFKYTCRILL